MAWERCDNCKKEYFQKKGDVSCPNCNELIEPVIPVKSPAEVKELLISKAGNQAKVVDKFGEVLQVIGYVLMAIFTILLLVSLFTKNWEGFIYSIIAIPATFVLYNVFGSAIRAIALYIQVKVQ